MPNHCFIDDDDDDDEEEDEEGEEGGRRRQRGRRRQLLRKKLLENQNCFISVRSTVPGLWETLGTYVKSVNHRKVLILRF